MLVGLILGSSGPATAQPSPMFRGGPQHTGVYEAAPVRQLSGVRWSVETGSPVRSTPALVDGVAFIGSSDGHLYAVDAGTGAQQWRYRTEGAVTSSPAVVDGVVYFTSRDDHLYALDATSGTLRWRYPMTEVLPYAWGFDYYTSSPAVVDGIVYVGGGDGFLHAVDARSGERRWRFEAGSWVRSSPAVDDGVVYAGDMEGHLYAVDAQTGRERWRFKTVGASLDPADFGFDRRAVISSPAVVAGRVVFGGRDGFLYAVDAGTGAERWRFDHKVSWVISSPAVDDDLVFTGTSDGQFVQAVELRTGAERWRVRTDGTAWTSPAVAGDVVFVGSAGGYLYALDRETGDEHWRFRVDGGFHGSPVVQDGVVYAGSNDGRLYALAGETASGGAARRVHRAVYWIEDPHFNWFQQGQDRYVRQVFEANGYEVVGDSALAAFMEQRLADGAPSVVVFATHRLPLTVAADTSAAALVRRYLDAAGKVVWLGLAPPAYVRDREMGDVRGIDFSIPERIFGVRYDGPDTRGFGGFYGVTLTEDGRRWGLQDWWVGAGAVDPGQVSTVLGRDERGKAAAWVKNYGGPDGTGLVQLWVDRHAVGDLGPILSAAEYGLR